VRWADAAGPPPRGDGVSGGSTVQVARGGTTRVVRVLARPWVISGAFAEGVCCLARAHRSNAPLPAPSTKSSSEAVTFPRERDGDRRGRDVPAGTRWRQWWSRRSGGNALATVVVETFPRERVGDSGGRDVPAGTRWRQWWSRRFPGGTRWRRWWSRRSRGNAAATSNTARVKVETVRRHAGAPAIQALHSRASDVVPGSFPPERIRDIVRPDVSGEGRRLASGRVQSVPSYPPGTTSLGVAVTISIGSVTSCVTARPLTGNQSGEPATWNRPAHCVVSEICTVPARS
jgi:hypothetical protein